MDTIIRTFKTSNGYTTTAVVEDDGHAVAVEILARDTTFVKSLVPIDAILEAYNVTANYVRELLDSGLACHGDTGTDLYDKISK